MLCAKKKKEHRRPEGSFPAWMFLVPSVTLFLLLLPHMVCNVPSTNCATSDPPPIPHEWQQPGEVLVGGIITLINIVFANLKFKECPSREAIDTQVVITKFYQHLLALAFAINEINENLKILPNITLGFHIYDSNYDPRMTYRTILDLLFRSKRFLPNYKCGVQRNVVGVIGGLDSDTSSCMAELLQVYKIPQISYGSFESTSTDETHFPSFYRMVPTEALQITGIVQLLWHFKWKWVGLIIIEDDGGDNFLHSMERLFSENGICSAFTRRVQKNARSFNSKETIICIKNNIPDFMESSTKACVIYGNTQTVTWLEFMIWLTTVFLPLRFPGYKGKVSAGKVWIMTSQTDFLANLFQRYFDIQMFHGTISFAIHSAELAGFQEFLQNTNHLEERGNTFIQEFWEQAFDCLIPNLVRPTDADEACTGEETLEDLPTTYFEKSISGHSYSIYNAVYAVAHALHSIYTSRFFLRRTQDSGRWTPLNVQPWQVTSSQ
ncbi:vomeronasal type-2 receptor 26-like [Heteronotia binoei]|uniref:vomeronasal type-2 receptor 26-like n=1 Tax=Heteronotia binoei TaxID=13085 RepID=UPI00292FD4AD|nr:vomeronasal type-2 receptor 26-like [Heteronotia binoei]